MSISLLAGSSMVLLRRKSTSTNLLETLNDWTLAIDNGDSITAAYIDFGKAFDSVSHQKLL